MQNTHNALDFRVESETEKRTVASSNQPTHRSRLLLEEFLVTNFRGSVYHPNLVTFDIDLENGLSQRKEKFQSSAEGEFKNSYLNRFHVLSLFLREKPYAFSLSADKSREIQNREFFERQTIDGTRYAGNFGYRNDFIPVHFSFSNDAKTIDRLSRPSQEFKDEEINLSLNNISGAIGDTRLDFTQDKFSRTESGIPDQKGTSTDVNLFNQKPLSADNTKLLNSSIHFYELTGTRESSIFNLNEGLEVRHNDFLNSSYRYNFSDRSSGDVNTQDNRLNFDIRHQLYESLRSAFNLHYFNSDATNFSQRLYGFSLNEDYVKKLGRIGKLSTGVGLSYDEEERKAPGGIISIIDESQTLMTGDITFLDRPSVDAATVVVTNTAGTITYTVNVDYQLIALGGRLQIQRIPGGSIANGQQVLVDYRAATSPSFEFNTFTENYRFQMDFLDDILSIFYRKTRENHPRIDGEENAILQNLMDTVYGLGINYKNFKIEWENEDYDSNLSPYKRQGLKESLFFNPTSKSVYTLQSSQSRIQLIKTEDTQRFYDIINRYAVNINQATRLNLEAGYRWQRGGSIDLDDLTGRFNIEFNLGKFMLTTEYNFEKQLYLGDSLINHFFFTRIKRDF